jgi:hypothetical protein
MWVDPGKPQKAISIHYLMSMGRFSPCQLKVSLAAKKIDKT